MITRVAFAPRSCARCSAHHTVPSWPTTGSDRCASRSSFAHPAPKESKPRPQRARMVRMHERLPSSGPTDASRPTAPSTPPPWRHRRRTTARQSASALHRAPPTRAPCPPTSAPLRLCVKLSFHRSPAHRGASPPIGGERPSRCHSAPLRLGALARAKCRHRNPAHRRASPIGGERPSRCHSAPLRHRVFARSQDSTEAPLIEGPQRTRGERTVMASGRPRG